jgi:uncharacterized membrane protein YfcA
MFVLAVLFGCGVGFALGLTGGGGGVFAVPLLVYGLAVAPREAVGISLASVGVIALAGVIPRFVREEVELRTGLLLSVAGMVGAPIGSYLSTLLSETVLLVMFGCLMLIVAWQMWAKTRHPGLPIGVGAPESPVAEDRSACQRDEDGTLRLTSRCARLLMLVGLLTGVLSGMFGVGGGFVIVPALVLFSDMEIHRAVGTSLLVIFLISISGVTSYVATGRELSLAITLQFLVGGVIGIWLGGLVAKRLKGPTLQKVFSAAVVLVAAFVIVKTVVL